MQGPPGRKPVHANGVTPGSLEDTQSEKEVRNIPIHRVGVRDLRHPIRVCDRGRTEQSTVARVALSVSLPGNRRGTHMSRFVSLLNDHAEVVSVSTIRRIPPLVMEILGAEAATAEFAFPFFISKKAPVSGIVGTVDYDVTLETSAAMDAAMVDTMTLRVPVTTLCPCSRNISERGAHNQRGVVLLTLHAAGTPLPWIEDMVRLVESCASSELYSLLKRPDEKYVTEAAYDQPVFVEDLVRNVAEKINSLGTVRSYRIEAENFESIHNHSAFAVIEEG